jgi:GLPGLI family protein
MKYRHLLLSCSLLLLCMVNATAQDFVTRGKIEFEKKVNLQRSLANSNMPQQYREMYPDSRITYHDLIFAGNESLYKAGKDYEPPVQVGGSRNTINFGKNTDVLYANFSTKKTVLKKNIVDEDFLFEDSISSIKWKIGQETRKIAGYECRKAIGRIFDTVYLIAFYAEELILKGGPEGIQGLPGMILGLAIPRYNTTWFATKVELANIDESAILPPVVKGKKLSREETKAKLVKKYEQMGVKNPLSFIDRLFKPVYTL